MADFKTCGGKVVLMIGGAGGGYETLLNPQYSDVCLSLLLELLTSKKALIDGVDFDVEQPVDIDKLLRVVRAVQVARPGILLTFAPLASSLQNDSPGMGGFSYKPLLQLGVAYFNGQFYGDWGRAAFRSAVNNGYPADRVVMGCLATSQTPYPRPRAPPWKAFRSLAACLFGKLDRLYLACRVGGHNAPRPAKYGTVSAPSADDRRAVCCVRPHRPQPAPIRVMSARIHPEQAVRHAEARCGKDSEHNHNAQGVREAMVHLSIALIALYLACGPHLRRPAGGA